MGAQTNERFTLFAFPDLTSEVLLPRNSGTVEMVTPTPIRRLLGGQELVLDVVRAGPGGWSVSAGADGTTVFTSSLEGWTFFVIPPD